jgi:hypothetical protein
MKDYKLKNGENLKENQRKKVELKGEIELILYDKNNSKIKLSAAYEALEKAEKTV